MGDITEVKKRLREARSVTVLTGAGVSAESGVPTFRGKDGLWRNYAPEDLATPEAFARDPSLVWEWYNMRREKLLGIEPNAAHMALVEMERKTEDFTLITQNVDGLHGRAGSGNLLELHGNIWKVRCTRCRSIEDNDDVPIDIPPYCATCGCILRPHIVWFGEMLHEDVLEAVYASLGRCEMMIVAGTSGIIQPAASFVAMAKRIGAHVVEINLEETPNSGVVDETILGKAGEVLPGLIDD